MHDFSRDKLKVHLGQNHVGCDPGAKSATTSISYKAQIL